MFPAIATYVHDLDPIALPISGNLALRWYGIAYLLGFLAGIALLKYLARRRLWVLPAEKAADFVAAAAILGVFIGGRLGYIFLYEIPREGIAAILEDPLVIIRVWDGGMASHGGILGLVIFTWFYSRRAKVSWTGLGDGLCVVAPIGLMFGRLANFINGELYGRVAHGVSWAVKFPLTFRDPAAPERLHFDAAAAAAARVEPSLRESVAAFADAREAIAADPSTYQAANYAQDVLFQKLLIANQHSQRVSEAIAPYLEPRHPSQIYAALLEGLLLFTILWVVRLRFRNAPNGLLTGLFFGLYATFRIFDETFREPDAAWAIQDVLTMGQFYSLFMYLFAAAFLIYAWKQCRQAPAAAES